LLTFAALAPPTRRAIVARLALGDATLSGLAAPFDMTLPGVSKHLKVHERCGLICRYCQGRFRPYRLEHYVLGEIVLSIEDARRVWSEHRGPPLSKWQSQNVTGPDGSAQHDCHRPTFTEVDCIRIELHTVRPVSARRYAGPRRRPCLDVLRTGPRVTPTSDKDDNVLRAMTLNSSPSWLLNSKR
jgi:DNA-binding transcriptional ArsR family regulator